MKYATAAFAAVLLCSGAASAQSLSGIGQYHKDKSNLQTTSETKPAAADASAAASTNTQVAGNACQAGAAGATDASAANGAVEGSASCATATPPAAAPEAQPAPQ